MSVGKWSLLRADRLPHNLAEADRHCNDKYTEGGVPAGYADTHRSMNYYAALHTDIGIKKKTNQDSALILEADTEKGKVLLACICDGMGGLAKGEVASAALISAYTDWFYYELPKLLYTSFDSESIRNSMEKILFDMNIKIMDYGKKCGVNLGTTAVAMLIADGKYYISTVGDSRSYLISDNLYQLTKDHTLMQREIDMGRLTREEAAVHPQRNVLLQCIGASDFIVPDFFEGQALPGYQFMLCSDGFRHLITPEEFYEKLRADKNPDFNTIRQALVDLTELNKSRFEDDNITSLVIRIGENNDQ